ncbi:protein of unknown function [Candidatus Nitrosocosmicus franklandus]|uniref:Uncharacterized protein n=1 Tax=Candidatus Nitrosocosmicus franklandianus TaxID=1798806 RepID=A0A484IE45_9ARCH|nr:protein of unknown function [Candidatus Nitrosocosmicus franklandus]
MGEKKTISRETKKHVYIHFKVQKLIKNQMNISKLVAHMPFTTVTCNDARI